MLYYTMNNKKQQDLKFGFSSEDTSKMYLERRFGVLDKTDKYNKFDFVNDKYKVELKTRKCKFGDYPDLQFEVGKIVEAKKYLLENPEREVYFIWRCIKDGWDEKGFYYWKYNEDEYFEGEGGRVDRGAGEWKILAKIKNEYINPLF